MLQRRRALQEISAPPFYATDTQLVEYTAVLPFALTGAQERVIGEMLRDLERSVPMTRLVQGDVGSGKTAVAAAAMWVAALNGLQSAMLAPTQILAEQHHRGVSRLLGQLTRPDGNPVNVPLLTGRVTGESREQVLDGLADGTVDVVVGTTALIQETVEFANLGLVVVDEQHRFGVEQRGVLRNKAEGQPHLLVMSATPIPRSLALTVYGDLDISAIDEMPPGRTPITTKLFEQADRQRLYNFIRREIDAGRQAYIVYPLVEESDVLDVGAATAEHKRLQEEVFPDLKVALLHGRMTGSEKDAVMTAFAAGETQILVSTTVIEVGIDVPNATVMLIEDADRFGLAQMHQLRGRVGRGEYPGYCALITKSATPATRERLLLLTDKEHGRDGFWIAQKDLELRGPGEFLGTRQSGLPGLKVAQLSDIATMQQAREAAEILFAQDPAADQLSAALPPGRTLLARPRGRELGDNKNVPGTGERMRSPVPGTWSLHLPPLLDRHVIPLVVAQIHLPRAGDLLLGIRDHFQPLGQPARGAAQREQHREHVGREAHRLVDDAAVEVHVGIELAGDEVLVVQRHFLQRHRHVDQRIGAGDLKDVIRNLLDDAGARVIVLVDTVAKAHQPEFALLHPRHVLRHILGVADLGQHANDGLVGAAVAGTEQRRRCAGHGAVGVGIGRADRAHHRGRGILLVVGMQNEEHVQRLGQHRVHGVVWSGSCSPACTGNFRRSPGRHWDS